MTQSRILKKLDDILVNTASIIPNALETRPSHVSFPLDLFGAAAMSSQVYGHINQGAGIVIGSFIAMAALMNFQADHIVEESINKREHTKAQREYLNRVAVFNRKLSYIAIPAATLSACAFIDNHDGMGIFGLGLATIGATRYIARYLSDDYLASNK